MGKPPRRRRRLLRNLTSVLARRLKTMKRRKSPRLNQLRRLDAAPSLRRPSRKRPLRKRMRKKQRLLHLLLLLLPLPKLQPKRLEARKLLPRNPLLRLMKTSKMRRLSPRLNPRLSLPQKPSPSPRLKPRLVVRSRMRARMTRRLSPRERVAARPRPPPFTPLPMMTTMTSLSRLPRKVEAEVVPRPSPMSKSQCLVLGWEGSCLLHSWQACPIPICILVTHWVLT